MPLVSGGWKAACVVMAKWPEPGRVKTRLAREIGPEAAAELARAMLQDTLDRACEAPAQAFLAVDAGEGTVSEEMAGVPVEPQRGEGLGERIAHAVAGRWEAGREAVVVLGTDSPNFPDAFLMAALEALTAGAASVLGPTRDGGLYLLGFRRGGEGSGGRLHRALGPLAWGTEVAFEEVRRALAPPLGPPEVLEPWYDVDLPEDLARLARDLDDPASPGRPSPHIHRWLRF